MTPLDPNKPLPVWTHRRGEERDPERIDILLEQLRSLWTAYPTQRLGQLLVNLCDPKPNPLFYVEDHVVSKNIHAVRESGWAAAASRGESPGDRADATNRPQNDG